MLKALRTPITLFNPQSFTARSAFSLPIRVRAVRSYATEAALPSTSSPDPATTGRKSDVPEGPLRPHLGVEVNPNHGLWAFFRRKVEKSGELSYETIETRDNATHYSGRAWSAAELRRKSFKDLHTLWYVVLRERNLLETQTLEAKRLGAMLEMTPVKQRMFRCRKTMARIKYVINERRVAYEGAVQLMKTGRGFGLDLLTPKEREALRALETDDQNAVPEHKNEKAEEHGTHQTAAERAAAGLVRPGPVRK